MSLDLRHHPDFGRLLDPKPEELVPVLTTEQEWQFNEKALAYAMELVRANKNEDPNNYGAQYRERDVTRVATAFHNFLLNGPAEEATA